MKKLLFFGYCLFGIGLFFYSYTQVDLNLTLSRFSIWQVIQKTFQYIGYYQRPLSTVFFCILIVLAFILYGIACWLVRSQKLQRRDIWMIVVVLVLLLVFSYPAFSYDIFNYLFNAKLLMVYGKNPYVVKPLDFSGFEPWLTFMRWTHVTSVYTPVWIGLSVIPYVLGFGYFLLALWSMKWMIALFYLLAVWCIEKILLKQDHKYATLGMVIFALNPLVIIECLVSGHNDIVMMAASLVAYVFFLKKNMLASYFFLAWSMAVKHMTLFLLPLPFFGWKPLHAIVAMSSGLVLVLFATGREILPWYFLWILPFVALLPKTVDFIILSAGISLGLLLRYAPFLYYGHWDSPVPTIKFWVTIVPIGFALCIIGGRMLILHRGFPLRSLL